MKVFKPYYSKALPGIFTTISRNGQKFAKFTDGRGQAREERLTRRGDKLRIQVKRYRIEFEDDLGVRRELKAFTNKRASEQLGDKIERLLHFQANDLPLDKELKTFIREKIPAAIREKLIEFELVRLQDAEEKSNPAGKPLSELIAEFEDSLRGKECDPKYIGEVIVDLKRTFARCNIRFWSEIDRTTIDRYLTKLRADGLSFGRSNNILKAVKGFCNWMIESEYVKSSPVLKLKSLDAKRDRRHIRRALELDEFQRFLKITATEPERWGLTGYERALIYRFAVETGLRANELRTLTIASFDLKNLTVTVKAGDSKHRREDVLPIRKKTAEELTQYFAGKIPTVRAFKGTWAALTDHTANMIKEDLAAANIPYEDESGRVFDFHALRHQCGTFLAAAGVHPKIAKDLMRHSDINMTMSLYTHTLRGQEAAAVESLPDLSSPSIKSGTDNQNV